MGPAGLTLVKMFFGIGQTARTFDDISVFLTVVKSGPAAKR